MYFYHLQYIHIASKPLGSFWETREMNSRYYFVDTKD